ncbi:M23 family metallopeptidase [Rheinheimera sp. UJ63]|uniref:M23 family metallopeptidase n=1 Tax=Rheinheimera sp. UJ63 TaxID=2910157 RepID=UPI001F3F3E55|nr:M23 family metallopeptidase [Rheinheimera sp. UJ63]MCF4009605.1 M23 family metallopeptidase [Rheinheimera sp. UJ63]
MKVWVKALLLCAISVAANAAEVVLHGPLTQGSLIRGQAPMGAQIWFNEQPVVVSAQGQFVFGIGRDAALQHQLKVVHQGKQQQFPLRFTAREYDIQRITGVEQKYVAPPKEVSARIANDNAKVRQVRSTLSELDAIFSTPVRPAAGRISGVYGSQRVFNGQPRNPHFGLDIAAPVGAPVLAPWPGKVLLAEDLYFSGLTVIVDHGFGVSSTFMHLNAIKVKVGDTVAQSQHIADIGATGRVTGPHLDWRINWFQERLDPQLLLPEFTPNQTQRLALTP